MPKFTAVHKRRLRKLAVLLRGLTRREAKHFNMENWYTHSGDERRPTLNPMKPTKDDFMHCGTAGCAMGWATTIPSFQKLGLRLRRYEGEYIVALGRSFGAYSAVKLFGLTNDTAYWLISDQGLETLETPKQVAKRIDRLIAAKGQLPAAQ